MTTSSKGTAGDDVIVGLGGNDIIQGQGGNDTICAGLGSDTVNGDAGEVTQVVEGWDRIDAGRAKTT